MKVAVVGLGPMGSRIAMRLLERNFEVAVWNRTAGKADSLLERGAREADTPAEAADGAVLVLSMVANDSAVSAVTLSEDGIAAGLRRDAVHVGCSTISVALAREVAAAHERNGQSYVSATVLGRPPAAEQGALYIMLAGAEAHRTKAMPVLEAFSQRVFVVGDAPWQSNLVKLCANFMIFSTIEQFAEVFALCGKAGVAETTVFDVLTNSFCSSPVHKNYGKIILERSFSPPGGAMELGKKDNDLLLQAGEAFGAALPIASLLRDRFLVSMARGDRDLDFAALSKRALEDAGLA